jgi:hypothetical protein
MAAEWCRQQLAGCLLPCVELQLMIDGLTGQEHSCNPAQDCCCVPMLINTAYVAFGLGPGGSVSCRPIRQGCLCIVHESAAVSC